MKIVTTELDILWNYMSANIIHKTANQHIYFLTAAGTGTINFGTSDHTFDYKRSDSAYNLAKNINK